MSRGAVFHFDRALASAQLAGFSDDEL